MDLNPEDLLVDSFDTTSTYNGALIGPEQCTGCDSTCGIFGP